MQNIRWIERNAGYEVALQALTPPWTAGFGANSFGGAEFAALLLGADPAVTQAEQDALVELLQAAGCVQVLRQGQPPAQSEPMIDWDDLDSLELALEEAATSTTSWISPEQSDEDACHALIYSTSTEEFDASRLLVLLLGEDAERETALAETLRQLLIQDKQVR